MPLIRGIFYTERECSEKNNSVADAIVAFKRFKVANGHPVRMDVRMLFNQLSPEVKITTLQMNGLVAQAINLRSIPNGYDLKPLEKLALEMKQQNLSLN